ncbi:MAG: type VI secretion system tube protein Hcp, partial [Alphaproteobacteria bacterium]
IDFCTTGDRGNSYLQYELTDSLISAYTVISGGERPEESISFEFTKVEMAYVKYDSLNQPINNYSSSYEIPSATASQ